MKLSHKLICLLLAVLFVACTLTACGDTPPAETTNTQTVTDEDFAEKTKLDMHSSTVKVEVTVKTFVDGDTTHFNAPANLFDGGVVKARYLAINTPESTGKIEEWGKKASNFTKSKLSQATSIIIESDDENWNLDSTGGRYLLWVWYKTSDSEDYRNLNIEILQNGLAIASNAGGNRYGSICLAAIDQARRQKLNIYSGQKDPDFYYGDAYEVTLRELRTNLEQYSNTKVAFEGVITRNNNNGVYVEEYDEETGLYYGIYVYYGFNLPGEGIDILKVGNRSRIVGSVQYYEGGDSYQVSGLTYKQMKPNDPGNIQKIGDGYTAAYVETDPKTFAEGKVTIETDEDSKTYDYAFLTMNTSVSMKNLKVKSVYTTDNEDSSSYGAITMTCEVDGIKITVRTIPMMENGKLVTEDRYLDKTIDVKGIVDSYNGSYQIKVFTLDSIVIK